VTLIHLHADGVSMLLDARDGLLPSVVHWGESLPGLDEHSATALADAVTPLIAPNGVDLPVRVSILPEGHTGFTGRPGVSGSRGGRGWSPRFTTTDLRLDGDPVGNWVSAAAATLVVEATDDELDLDLTLTVEMTRSGLVRTRARLVNRGEPYGLEGIVLALPVPTRAVELLDFAGRWGLERFPQRGPFLLGTHLREGRRGRTGADAATLLHAGTTGFGFGGGEVWAVHTAWSGNHVHYAERTWAGQRLLGGGELLLPGEVVLETGQGYESPWVYAAFGHGLDAVASRFHRHLRSRPGHPHGPRPVTLNVWEAVYFDHDEERLLDLAERAARLGIERFVLDDCWFGARRDDHAGLGDWVVSADVWPRGLHPLVDRVRELGMQFGLWFEPEMVNADSDLARAHPEWVMSARSTWPVESRFQQVLDLAVPEAYEHVLGQMDALLTEYEIGYLKWDHNRDLVEAGNQLDGGRPAVHEQTAATYRLMATLKERHPGLEIESCSSGGARVDLGVMEHADRVWVSDDIDPLERQAMMRWTTQLLPPELLGSHIASGRSHTTSRTHDLSFRAATAVFGHLGVEWDLGAASTQELAELGAWVRWYRDQRELLHTGTVVRVDEPGEGVLVHGVVSDDLATAVFAWVLTAYPLEDPAPRIVLRGLDPGRSYRIRPGLVGARPDGLHAPTWWGGEPVAPAAYVAHGGSDDPGGRLARPGVVLPGSALMSAGVAAPRMHPDHVVLLEVTAAEAAASA
jgi:alpha-galactosidase